MGVASVSRTICVYIYIYIYIYIIYSYKKTKNDKNAKNAKYAKIKMKKTKIKNARCLPACQKRKIGVGGKGQAIGVGECNLYKFF